MDADQLYGLPLERFVPERNALARSLRAAGQREEAANIARLRKPSVAAWAVNQLIRTQGRAVGDLLDAGDGLRQAHADVVSGSGDGRALRGAVERERATVDELIAAARGLLSTDGHDLSAAIIDRVADTLHAAALDPDARDEVRDGRLERELRHVGLGSAPAGTPGAPSRARQRPARKPTAEERAERDQRIAEDRAERDREAARKAAQAAESQARRESDRAGSALRAALEHRERAEQKLHEAVEVLARAQAAADAAYAAHRRAVEHLERSEV
jgi:hypothetical protein